MSALILEAVFIDKDKHLLFSLLTVKKDVFYKKQLKQILKEEYRASVKDYEKTADFTGLDNSYVKSIIYNTIMKVLFFAYAEILIMS